MPKMRFDESSARESEGPILVVGLETIVPESEPVKYVDMVCPHDGRTYPCYDWTVESLRALGWFEVKGK